MLPKRKCFILKYKSICWYNCIKRIHLRVADYKSCVLIGWGTIISGPLVINHCKIKMKRWRKTFVLHWFWGRRFCSEYILRPKSKLLKWEWMRTSSLIISISIALLISANTLRQCTKQSELYLYWMVQHNTTKTREIYKDVSTDFYHFYWNFK